MQETMVLGASSDFACRVWNLADRRLKVNLTGHSDRVVSARFFPCTPANSIVTASIDRTIKVSGYLRNYLKNSICIGFSEICLYLSYHLPTTIDGLNLAL